MKTSILVFVFALILVTDSFVFAYALMNNNTHLVGVTSFIWAAVTITVYAICEKEEIKI